MKRLLITIVIFANLFTGLAFAADMHPEVLANHEQVVADVVDQDSGAVQQTGNDSKAAHSCDHCCHGAAHLTGMTYAVIVSLVPRGDSYQPVRVYSLISRSITPHLRPPIA